MPFATAAFALTHLCLQLVVSANSLVQLCIADVDTGDPANEDGAHTTKSSAVLATPMRAYAVEALANLTRHRRGRKELLRHGVVQALVALLGDAGAASADSVGLRVRRGAAAAAANLAHDPLCRGVLVEQQDTLPVLFRLCHTADTPGVSKDADVGSVGVSRELPQQAAAPLPLDTCVMHASLAAVTDAALHAGCRARLLGLGAPEKLLEVLQRLPLSTAPVDDTTAPVPGARTQQSYNDSDVRTVAMVTNLLAHLALDDVGRVALMTAAPVKTLVAVCKRLQARVDSTTAAGGSTCAAAGLALRNAAGTLANLALYRGGGGSKGDDGEGAVERRTANVRTHLVHHGALGALLGLAQTWLNARARLGQNGNADAGEGAGDVTKLADVRGTRWYWQLWRCLAPAIPAVLRALDILSAVDMTHRSGAGTGAEASAADDAGGGSDSQASLAASAAMAALQASSQQRPTGWERAVRAGAVQQVVMPALHLLLHCATARQSGGGAAAPPQSLPPPGTQAATALGTAGSWSRASLPASVLFPRQRRCTVTWNASANSSSSDGSSSSSSYSSLPTGSSAGPVTTERAEAFAYTCWRWRDWERGADRDRDNACTGCATSRGGESHTAADGTDSEEVGSGSSSDSSLSGSEDAHSREVGAKGGSGCPWKLIQNVSAILRNLSRDTTGRTQLTQGSTLLSIARAAMVAHSTAHAEEDTALSKASQRVDEAAAAADTDTGSPDATDTLPGDPSLESSHHEVPTAAPAARASLTNYMAAMANMALTPSCMPAILHVGITSVATTVLCARRLRRQLKLHLKQQQQERAERGRGRLTRLLPQWMLDGAGEEDVAAADTALETAKFCASVLRSCARDPGGRQALLSADVRRASCHDGTGSTADADPVEELVAVCLLELPASKNLEVAGAPTSSGASVGQAVAAALAGGGHRSNAEVVVAHGAEALALLAAGGGVESRRAMLARGTAKAMGRLCEVSNDGPVLESCAKALGALAGDAAARRALLDAGAVPGLARLCTHPASSVVAVEAASDALAGVAAAGGGVGVRAVQQGMGGALAAL